MVYDEDYSCQQVRSALEVLYGLCRRGGDTCFHGNCPFALFCCGYMKSNDTNPYYALKDDDDLEDILDFFEKEGVIK